MTLTNTHKGIIFMIAGGLLLFNTFGIVGPTLNIFVAICAVLIFILGFILVDGHKQIQHYIEKMKTKKNNK